MYINTDEIVLHIRIESVWLCVVNPSHTVIVSSVWSGPTNGRPKVSLKSFDNIIMLLCAAACMW